MWSSVEFKLAQLKNNYILLHTAGYIIEIETLSSHNSDKVRAMENVSYQLLAGDIFEIETLRDVSQLDPIVGCRI